MNEPLPPRSSVPPRPVVQRPPENSLEEGLELAPNVRVREGDGAVEFSYARSSGPGGQNVNKLATKAELRVRPGLLPISPRARGRLVDLAGSRATTEGEIIITSESQRSQSRNKSECLDKLRALLVAAMAVPKVRRKTKPTKGSRERRLTEKKNRGEIKKRRGGSDHE